jgi:hypothetical protein
MQQCVGVAACDHGVEVGVRCLDARQHCPHQLDRRCLAAAQGCRQLDQGETK